MKKLIPALVLLLVSAMVLSTSSYAWFSMNKTVSATGMELKATVSNNLLIADGTSVITTAKAAESAFQASFSKSIKGIIEPSSTTTGKTFFYTTDAKADGSKTILDADHNYLLYTASDAASLPDTYADKFSEDYGVSKTAAAALVDDLNKAVPYVDYVFQLKATNTEVTAVALKLSKLDLEYTKTDTEVDNEKAYRVAVFTQKLTGEETLVATADEGTLVTIYAPTGYKMHTEDQAVTSTDALGTVTYNDPAKTKIDEVSSSSTEYFKVVIRLYIEGEDTTCTNETFLPLNGSWALKVAFTLESDVANVTALTIKAAE